MNFPEDISLKSKSIVRKVDGKPVTIEVKIHPSTHRKVVVINYPGVYGDIDGFNSKYTKIAGLVAEKIGTTLRISWAEETLWEEFESGVSKKLEAVIKDALQNSQELAECEPNELEIYLMGFSTWASWVAAVCGKYPQIKKILLIAPSWDAWEEACESSLGSFTWEVHVLVGENDEVVGWKAAHIFAQMAKSAKRVKELTIPNCDHQFRWSKNGQLMSAAPIWAFLKNGEGELDPNDGIIIY